ncbi:MAG: phosphodiester glycosidase family protein [Pseudomonadota bacterium]
MNRRTLSSISALALIIAAGCARLPQQPCAPLTHADTPFIVCTFDAADHDIRLFLNGADGAPYGQFETLASALETDGERLVFAMNAGMYLPDRRPVGLLIEDHEQRAPINLADGDSNFTLKPNGVFWTGAGTAGILESEAFDASPLDPAYASQSGPMLVIDGALHPAFNADGPSRYRRNGVGVAEDGRTVYFAISEVPVNFHTFASLFRDRLTTPNALYFDGRVSLIYAPNLTRLERGLDMGPIVGVVAKEN